MATRCEHGPMVIEKLGDLAVLIAFTLAGITGAAGGCAAANWVWTGRPRPGVVRSTFVAAYGFLGFFQAITICGLLVAFDVMPIKLGLEGMLGFSALSGMITPGTLVVINKIAIVRLKWRGIEVQLTARHPGEERRRRMRDEHSDG